MQARSYAFSLAPGLRDLDAGKSQEWECRPGCPGIISDPTLEPIGTRFHVDGAEKQLSQELL